MKASVERPILVTGAHRSGTTWVGAMLTLSPGIGLIHEPFNPTTRAGIAGAPFKRYFQYVCPENEQPYVRHLERAIRFSYHLRRQLETARSARGVVRAGVDLLGFTANRMRGARALIKDPIAVFSSEWLASRFDAQVVVLIRHPAAFASSVVRLRSTHDFGTFLDQPLLMRDHLAAFEDEIRDFAARERESLDQAILLWRLIYATVNTLRERHPDWSFLRHEDLSREPVSGFESLFETVGVELGDRIRRKIVEHSGEENPDELRGVHDVRLNSLANVDAWRRRLAPDQVERVRAGTADVAPAFYGDKDW